MITRVRVLALTVVAVALFVAVRAGSRAVDLPERLSDAEFWAIVTESSEPGGYFRSANITNLTSNELLFQHVIPDLVRQTRSGRAYLGVGPEQNFTYMAATRPRVAVIFDIRRGNLDLQLMYKALFELSATRADFVAMLFSRPRPADLADDVPVDQLFQAFAGVPMSVELQERGVAAILSHLTRTHRFALAPEDVSAIRQIHGGFSRAGFALRSYPTYADLMVADDGGGVRRSYLADEASFQIVKELQVRNLVIPVVGDFGGPKAIRAMGKWLERHGLTVSTFYLSNVEQYLWQDRKWEEFCRNVRALPLDETSTFIRSSSAGRGGFVSRLGNMRREVAVCGL